MLRENEFQFQLNSIQQPLRLITYKDVKCVGTSGKLDFLIASRHRCKSYQDHHEFNETLAASKTR